MTRTKQLKHLFEDTVWILPAMQVAEATVPITFETLALWESEGRLFSVTTIDGKRHFPHFQLDHNGQPFAVISDVIRILRPKMDDWTLLAWFRFPNSWIVDKTASKLTPIAPNAALTRPSELIRAAKNYGTTYYA